MTPNRAFRPFELAAVALALFVGGAADATTVSFRDGVALYSGTRDTFLEQNAPTTEHGQATTLRWDSDHPGGTGLDSFVLLRFEGIAGALPGQIRPGAVVNQAVLTYTVTNPGNTGELRETLADWNEANTLTSYCGTNCGPTVIGPLVTTMPGSTTGVYTATVTSSVQAWANGAPNRGWIVAPVGADGVEIVSSEDAVVLNRPLLTVTFDEAPQATVLRQPYLQKGTPTSMTLVWRTLELTDSRVRYGTSPGSLDRSVTVAGASADHVVALTGLTPATRYFYDVGSTTAVHAGGTSEHYFDTSPPYGTATPFRVWVVGDSGDGGAAQAQVRDAMLAATGSSRPDLVLHMGDIAYNTGTEQEFTDYHFTPYRDILRHTVLWPTLGNHEGASTVSGAPGASIGPYYDAFVLPAGGEAGGEPSGTEAYYAFDYGDVHFICLNSYQVNRSATAAMATWLTADLAATTQNWIVAFWHHPPYTHGTHNSDTEIQHIEMRQNILPILEAGGVDLVLGGHSHGYERSVFIDGAYATPSPDRETLAAQGHVLDAGDGRPGSDGSYWKNPGINPHEGAVFVVAGHGGAGLGGALDHPVMRFSEAVHGSVIMDVGGDTITLSNVRDTGVTSDVFAITKTPPTAPVVASTTPPRDATVTALPSIEVVFSAPVAGVDALDLTVAGVPAASLQVLAANRYRFLLASQPATGPVNVALAQGGIVHASNASLTFAGDVWALTMSCGVDGSPCNDGNPCTFADTCFGGTCVGAIPLPADVTNLGWQSNKVTLVWDDTAGLGSGGRYDVARGSTLDLPLDGNESSSCVEAALSATSAADATLPAENESWWYLVRGNTACYPGTWGQQTENGVATAQRVVNACP